MSFFITRHKKRPAISDRGPLSFGLGRPLLHRHLARTGAEEDVKAKVQIVPDAGTDTEAEGELGHVELLHQQRRRDAPLADYPHTASLFPRLDLHRGGAADAAQLEAADRIRSQRIAR